MSSVYNLLLLHLWCEAFCIWSIVITCSMLPVNITFELASAHITVKLYRTLFPPCLFLSVYPDSHDIWCLFFCCGVFETCWYRTQLSPLLSFGSLQVKLAIFHPDLSLHLERTRTSLLSLYSLLPVCMYAGGFLPTQQCILIHLTFFVYIRICLATFNALDMSLTSFESFEFSTSYTT